MKNLIMFFVLVMIMVFSNYEVSYSQKVETGNFYFLVGTEGNERAIMYLHIVGTNAYGSYYTKNQSIIYDGENVEGFRGSFDGKNLKLSYYDDNLPREITITGTLSSDIVFRGKHNSKNVNLSLANAPINSARIIEEDYNLNRFIFNVRTLDNLSYDGSIGANIVYLDENIIAINHYILYSGPSKESFIYLINTGKQIEMKDFISNLNDRNLLALLRKKVLEYAANSYAANSDDDSYDYSYETYYSFDNDLYSFYITPKGITFYTDYYYRYYENEEGPSASRQFSLYIDFTFEELKPFIKRGSPLDYLFN